MKRILILMFSLVLLTSLTTVAFSEDYSGEEKFEPTYYENAKVLRVKYTQGEAYVQRSYDEGFEEAAVNLPIFEKDTAGTTDGRLEVYLGRLNYLRLDYDTEVIFDKVPELRKTGMNVRVTKGGIYLDIENLDFERDIEIQTPDCGIFILDKGLYRINVNEGGRTELYVYEGIAEVSGSDYNRNVRENQKLVMFDGRVKERPFYFYSSDSDDFDRWSRERNKTVGYARYSSSRYLDEGYEEHEYELSRSGRWQYDSSYDRHVWIPYNVGADWRPYHHGRWVWSPHYGRVWNSSHTWGYFTHHYGRWHWNPIFHWYWIPGYRWSPAWVSWFWDDNYYGWCPLSWWNRPVIVMNGRWWRDYRYRGGIPLRARSTTIIRKGQLSASGIHRVALRKGAVGKITKKSIAFRGKGPGIKPVHSKVRVINARGKSVVYKRNGIVSTTKYKQLKSGAAFSGVKGKQSVVYKYSRQGGKISKEKTSKYSRSPYTKSSRSNYGTFKSKTSKYKSSGTYKPRKYGPSTTAKKSKTSSGFSKYKYRSKSSSKSTSKKSSGSSTKARSSTKKSKSKSSSGNYKKLKKKKDSPSYSYYSPSKNYSSYSGSSAKSTASKRKSYSSTKKKSSYSSYKPLTSARKKTSSSYSSSYKKYSPSSRSSYKSPSRSSYKSSYKSSSSSRPAYKSSSRSSYKSSYKSPSRSYSKSKPSSSYRSSSRSRSSSSYKSSPRRSSSSSRGSSSSGRSSSKSSSSSKSYKKK